MVSCIADVGVGSRMREQAAQRGRRILFMSDAETNTPQNAMEMGGEAGLEVSTRLSAATASGARDESGRRLSVWRGLEQKAQGQCKAKQSDVM